MLIQGNNVREAEILMHFWNAKQDENCTELDLREIDFDHGTAGTLIDILGSKQWDSIRITMCTGMVNDVLFACMSAQQRIASFSWHGASNSQTSFSLSYGLKYAKSLLHLKLTITIDLEAANWLAKAVSRNVWLESLDLSGSSIQDAAVNPLSFALRLNRTLKKVILDGCYLQDEQMAGLLLALQDQPELKVLSIQQNSCHTEGMGAIAGLLHYNNLEELDLSYLIGKKKEPKPEQPPPEEEEPLPQEESKEEDEQVEEEAKEEEKTEDDPAGEQTAADAPEQEEAQETKDEEPATEEKVDEEANKVRNTTLKSLQMAGNNLSDTFIESLLDVFGKGSALEELNLFGNRITDYGLDLIVKKLPHLKHLKCLWLGQNMFSMVSALCIAEAIKKNYSLEDVNIRSLDQNSEPIQKQLDYYARLNRGGRRIYGDVNGEDSIPLGLWPYVFERSIRIHWGGSTSNTTRRTHSADIIYALIRGPVLYENPNIPLSNP